MPKPYPREFREDVIRVARNREPGERGSAARRLGTARRWDRRPTNALAQGAQALQRVGAPPMREASASSSAAVAAQIFV